MIFAFGACVRRYDVALGVFLMFGARGLCLLLVAGIRQQFTDTSNLMDAAYYANTIQDRVDRPDASDMRNQRLGESPPP